MDHATFWLLWWVFLWMFILALVGMLRLDK